MNTELPQSLGGIAQHYKGNGRKLGYPTANVDVPTKLRDGVYFGYANLGLYKHKESLIFVGTPTTMGDTERRVEAHLFDIPDVDYYGTRLTMYVTHYHRSNETFDSVKSLIVAMASDANAAHAWFQAESLATGSEGQDT